MQSWNRYIKDFVSFLKIERGLAENSIFAYQNDVKKLMDFCEPRNLSPLQVSTNDLKTFVKELYD